jgi:hypothetical protein
MQPQNALTIWARDLTSPRLIAPLHVFPSILPVDAGDAFQHPGYPAFLTRSAWFSLFSVSFQRHDGDIRDGGDKLDGVDLVGNGPGDGADAWD